MKYFFTNDINDILKNKAKSRIHRIFNIGKNTRRHCRWPKNKG